MVGTHFDPYYKLILIHQIFRILKLIDYVCLSAAGTEFI